MDKWRRRWLALQHLRKGSREFRGRRPYRAGACGNDPAATGKAQGVGGLWWLGAADVLTALRPGWSAGDAPG
eukprot:2745515-Alexandrium_andersonii.AAC.1